MFHKSFSLTSLGAALLCALVAGKALAQTTPPPLDDRARRGLAIVPEGVKLNMKGRDRALVGLGSYLVNAVGGCNDCHTHPPYAVGGDPFKGQPAVINAAQYLTGGRQFGPITSPNLRPDEKGLPAGLRLWQFIRTIRSGHDPDPAAGGRLLQVMPWPVYGHMIQGDLRAIYEYLSALPTAPDNPNPGP
jgi:hypothetical protein